MSNPAYVGLDEVLYVGTALWDKSRSAATGSALKNRPFHSASDWCCLGIRFELRCQSPGMDRAPRRVRGCVEPALQLAVHPEESAESSQQERIDLTTLDFLNLVTIDRAALTQLFTFAGASLNPVAIQAITFA